MTADEAMSALNSLMFFFGEGDGGALEHVGTCVCLDIQHVHDI